LWDPLVSMETEATSLYSHAVLWPIVVYYRHDVTACIGFDKR
jgi:hypothetical protein